MHQPRLYSGPWAAGRGRECGTGRAASATRQGGRGSGAAGRGAPRRGGTSRGTPTSRAAASRTPRPGIPHLTARHLRILRSGDSAPSTPRQPSALAAGIPGTLRHLRHPPASPDPSAPRRPGTSQPPTSCASSPRSYLRPCTHSLLSSTSLSSPGAHQGTVPGSPSDAARCRHSRGQVRPICAEPPLLSPEPGKKEAKDQREYPVLPSIKPTSPRIAKAQGQGGLKGHSTVPWEARTLSQSLSHPGLLMPHTTLVSLAQGPRVVSPSSTTLLPGLESNQEEPEGFKVPLPRCFVFLSSVGPQRGTLPEAQVHLWCPVF